MGRRGNVVLIIILVIAVGIILFLAVPLGGRIGQFREELISFIFRKPPRFISLEVNVNDVPKIISAGEALRVTGNETIVITKIKANTFFDSYLSADVVGFGKDNDIREPIDASQVRTQLMDAGIKSVPVEIRYINHVIAKVPLEIDLSRQDFFQRLRDAKDADAKIAILKSAHVTFPQDRTILSMLDELLTKNNDYEGLASVYKGMVEADPEDTASWGELARCYIKLGMLKEAMDACSKIIEKGKGNANTYRRMAMIAGESGDFNARVGYLNKALELEPGNDAIIVDLGKTYEQAGDAGKALELYKGAAAKAKDKEILVPVIEHYLDRKNYEEAATLLKRYISFYPGDKNAYAQLGMAMGKLGKTGAQTAYYSKASSLGPKDTVLLYNLATSYEKAGKDKEALDTYRKVLALKSNDRDSLVRSAALSLKLGEYKEAYEYYTSLSKAHNDAEYKKGLLSAATGLKDPDRIIEAGKAYLRTVRDHDAAITLAYAYETRAVGGQGRARLEDMNAALDAYRLALKINPKSKKAQERIPELKIEIIKLKRGN